MIAFKLSVCHSPTPSNIAEDCQEKENQGEIKKKKKESMSKRKLSQAIDTKLKQAELKKPVKKSVQLFVLLAETKLKKVNQILLWFFKNSISSAYNYALCSEEYRNICVNAQGKPAWLSSLFSFWTAVIGITSSEGHKTSISHAIIS